jgi:hypothetical protein
MQIELVLIALLIGGLAVVIKLTGRLQRSWVERDLRRGDLRNLSDIAFRRIHGPAFDSVQRLRKRGFLVKTARAISDDLHGLGNCLSPTYFCGTGQQISGPMTSPAQTRC